MDGMELTTAEEFVRQHAPELIPQIDRHNRVEVHLATFEVLISFFNECEARLAVLEYAKRDYEEVRKLSILSERAEDIVAEARKTLAGIGATFLTEAMRVGNALGGLERVGILNLAEAVPVEDIEKLADRILESSDRERTVLERLTREVSP